MKRSAIDCSLNKGENGLTESCYFIPGTATKMSQSMEYMFDPDLDRHIMESASEFRAKK